MILCFGLIEFNAINKYQFFSQLPGPPKVWQYTTADFSSILNIRNEYDKGWEIANKANHHAAFKKNGINHTCYCPEDNETSQKNIEVHRH